MSQIYYQNIDADNITKEELYRIIKKIKNNRCCLNVKFKESSLKGYHILLECAIKSCDLCRLVFDDMKRYEIDLGREEKFKNTTFTEKEYFTGNMQTIKHYCERCLKYGNAQTLTRRELEIQDVRKKLRIGKIDNISYQLVYLAYIYLECPICHWFKFVKKKDYKLLPNRR